ncbi:MAG: acyl-CoA dehydrogenase [Clostridia bacterium]|nr:MAG: acyl-CoA dehydrogenase [Clostridia bacterium]
MFDYFLTEEQRLLQQTARRFAENEVAPQAEEADEKAEFNRELFRKIAEMGFMGINIPEEYDGGGQGSLSTALVIMELAKACGSTGMGVAAHFLGLDAILHYGTSEQKTHYLPPLARGEWLCAFALTEPAAGTDAAAVQTTAQKRGDKYIINGNKIFISNGGEAEVNVVFVKTDPSKGSRGMSALIVEKGTPGFTFGKKEDKMGMRGSVNRELIFEDCEVPIAHLIGEEGQGFKIAMDAINTGRIVTAAYTIGVGEAALEAATKYAKERIQFGKPIGEFQGIQFMLADMKVAVEAAKLFIYQAAYKADNGLPFATEASMAKLVSSDAAMKVTIDAVQIHGGYGYMKDYPVERYMRDAKITQILEGTNQIQRVIIARSLLK